MDKAYKIGYSKIKNGLWTCSFTLPLTDKKLPYVQPKYHIELYDHDKRIGRFIVNPKQTQKNESTREVRFHCEHVLSTLHSDILFRYHQYSNFTTRQVLEYLMANQEIKHWKLGVVSFTRYFHYSWENEDSLLNAMMSVPKSFDVPYLWTWDDSSYPFTLNLVEPSDEIKDVIVSGKNLKGIDLEEDPTNICTRIYPLGFGEGVNQLDITEVNGGLPYLQDDAAVNKYGIHKRVWVDSRFEDAETLKASAKGVLDKYKEPIITCGIAAIDYALKDFYNLAGYTVADVLQVFDLETKTDKLLRVEKMSKSDIYGQPDNISLEVGNRIADIGTTWADLQKKQLVNDTYSQGATNIDSRDFQDNCDPNYPVIIRFPVPGDVVNINEMKLTYETQPYRAYSKAIGGGGALVSSTASGGSSSQTSSSGGGSTQTSSSGGGTTESTTSGGGTTKSTTNGGDSTQTSSSGGGTTQSSSAGGDHHHRLFTGSSFIPPIMGNQAYRFRLAGGGTVGVSIPIESLTTDDIVTDTSSGNHSHGVSIPNHTHSVSVPAHNHSVTIPNHSHNVSIPNHTHTINTPAHTHKVDVPAHKHDITIPDHTHDLQYGIFESPETASAVVITVDGTEIPITATKGDDIDLIPYLEKGTDGKISRGRYAEIVITPNSLARINATVASRLFIQSRIGGTF